MAPLLALLKVPTLSTTAPSPAVLPTTKPLLLKVPAVRSKPLLAWITPLASLVAVPLALKVRLLPVAIKPEFVSPPED